MIKKDHFSGKGRILNRGSGIDAGHVLFHWYISLLAYHRNNACQKTFLRPVRKTFPLSVGARAGLIDEKNRLRFSLSLSFFANWTTISFKLDEYWQSVGNTGWLSLCAACFAKPRVPNGGRCTPEKPIENFSVIEGGDFDKFRYELRELKRKENEKKSRCTLTALSSPPLCPSKKKKKNCQSPFNCTGFKYFCSSLYSRMNNTDRVDSVVFLFTSIRDCYS